MSMFKSSSIRTKLPSSTSSLFKSVMLIGNSSGLQLLSKHFRGGGQFLQVGHLLDRAFKTQLYFQRGFYEILGHLSFYK